MTTSPMPVDCEEPVPIDYICRFCHRPGVAYYAAACDHLKIEKWQKMLCCDRCGEFYQRKQALEDGAWRICYTLAVLVETTGKNSTQGEARSIAREKLNTLTKRYAGLVCAYYRFTLVWEPDFTQMLIDQPRRCASILHDYTRRIATLRNTQ